MAEASDPRLAQLQEQQGAITRALVAMAEGRWLASLSGADSVEGWLLALNPTWERRLRPLAPLYVRDAPDIVPNIQWVGSPHYSLGRYGMPVCAIVVHTMAGTLAGSDNWFNDPRAQVSSHYGIGLDGRQHQYVALQNSSWANGVLEPGNDWRHIVGNSVNPNYQTVTVETEDLGKGSTPVTQEMYEGTLAVCRVAMRTYPGIRYLFGHRIISPNSRTQCCGDRWWGSGRFQQLADALGLEAYF